jgi:D-threo-aldose 1-dehydrogenase
MSEPGRVDQAASAAEWDIPEEFWSQVLPLALAGTGELG